MKTEIYQAAVRGDVDFLGKALDIDVESTASTYNDDDLLALTSQGNNIIHVAAQHGQLVFIKEALAIFPNAAKKLIICQTNSKGDTPLHLAARQSTKSIAELLVDAYHHVEKEIPMAIWRIKNNNGNTPLHEALINGGMSIQVAAYLLEIGPEVASYTNMRQETPLHLAVDYDTIGNSRIYMINTVNGSGASLSYTKSLLKEDSIYLIELLLEKNNTACCLHDADGMTPLLKATKNSYLSAVEAIIKYCPECMEICDLKGRNILHHINLPTSFETSKLLRKLHISTTLMDQQDDFGNTPMHIAAMNHNFGMVKSMIQKNANFAIKNYEGVSAATLVQSESESNSFSQIMKNDNRMATMEELMSKDLYEAAAKGEWESLTHRLEELDGEKLFLSRLPDGSNIFHIAIENCPLDLEHDDFIHKFLDGTCICYKEHFIVEALKKYPTLACQTNRRGQTPLHLAMVRRILNPDGMLFAFLEEHFKQVKDQTNYLLLPPWKVKDIDGNTLVHLALKHGRFKFAEYLLNLDAELVGQTNKFKETPLHMLCQNVGNKECIEMVDLLLHQDKLAVYMQDADGSTPLLRAIHSNLLQTAIRILHHCPQSIRHYDAQGRNIFHCIKIDQVNEDVIKELCEVVPEIEVFIRNADDEKNTPLHLALKNSEYGTAKFLMKHLHELRGRKQLSYDMKTILDILAAAQDVPLWFGEYISSQVCELPSEFIWGSTRSQYGIRKTQIKEYMNPVGLVAALLTTITFTAAFTVPGGYDGNGTPLLVKNFAFRIFMVSDVVGMCSSMMVLFCLLWFLIAYHDNDREELMLVDLTIGLLQVSFYATLVAFMTGVYATTFSHIPWLGICTCILCTAVILLMRKRYIFGVVLKVFFYIHFSIKFGAVSVMHYTKRILRL